MKFKIMDAHIHVGPSRDRMVPDLPTIDKEKILYYTAERLYFGWK